MNQRASGMVAIMAAKKTHGGKRPGAGRPRVIEDPVPYRVILERRDWEALKRLSRDKGRSAMDLMRQALQQLLRRHGHGR